MNPWIKTDAEHSGLLSGPWTIIRDDDAAAQGGACWWATKQPAKQAAEEYERDGGTVSSVLEVVIL